VPFCPSCRTEYVTGVSRCSDCDVELVDSLPESETQPNTNLVMLATFPNAAEARLILEILENNGIEALLRGDVDPVGNVVVAMAPALLVAEPDLPRAEEIYRAYFAGDAGDVALAPEEESEESDPDAQ